MQASEGERERQQGVDSDVKKERNCCGPQNDHGTVNTKKKSHIKYFDTCMEY